MKFRQSSTVRRTIKDVSDFVAGGIELDEIIENNNDFKQLEQKIALLDKKFSQLSD